MTRQERLQIIKEIEEERGSKLISYIAGDRRGLETRIASDIFPLFFKHLSQIGHQDSIDLFLYSTGGITIAGYGLVNLIREFCDKLTVFVPFKAYSCATLIALGANDIIMTKMGQLGPIDPSVNHPLSPTVPIPGQPGAVMNVPVNVEDVVGYMDLGKTQADLKNEESRVKAFEQLSSRVNPIVLGAVYRAREQIAFLAKTLLSYHMTEEEKIDFIVNTLTKERFSHDYLIGRKEAKDVFKLNVIDVSEALDKNIVKLYDNYNELLSLETPYSPEVFLKTVEAQTGNFNRGIIESIDLTHVYRTTKDVRRIQINQQGMPMPVVAFQERVLSDGWLIDNNI